MRGRISERCIRDDADTGTASFSLPHAKGAYLVRCYANGRVAEVSADVMTG